MTVVRGDRLSPESQAHVLTAYVHRWTTENAHRVAPANRPRMPLTSDKRWLRSYCFHVTKAGRLDRRYNHCEPAYMHGLEEGN